jgi:hypothetical protein
MVEKGSVVMPKKVISFPKSTVQSRSQVVNIPDLVSIVSVTVNTGNVSFSVSGKDVTVNVSNGAFVDYQSEGGQSKFVTATGPSYKGSLNDDCKTAPQSYYYSDSSHSGYIPKTGCSYSPQFGDYIWYPSYSGFVYTPSYTTYYYAYTVTIEYVSAVKIGVQKIAVMSNVLELQVYDPEVGMDGKNAARIKLSTKVGCYELVPVTDPKASPIRIQTPNGVKAIKKE